MADDLLQDLEQFIRDQVPKLKALGGAVTARDVRRHLWTFRHGGECLLECLVQRGFGRWEDRRPGPKGGRPTKVFVLIDETPAAEAAEDAV
jgi:hypothetical protein